MKDHPKKPKTPFRTTWQNIWKHDVPWKTIQLHSSFNQKNLTAFRFYFAFRPTGPRLELFVVLVPLHWTSMQAIEGRDVQVQRVFKSRWFQGHSRANLLTCESWRHKRSESYDGSFCLTCGIWKLKTGNYGWLCWCVWWNILNLSNVQIYWAYASSHGWSTFLQAKTNMSDRKRAGFRVGKSARPTCGRRKRRGRRAQDNTSGSAAWPKAFFRWFCRP